MAQVQLRFQSTFSDSVWMAVRSRTGRLREVKLPISSMSDNARLKFYTWAMYRNWTMTHEEKTDYYGWYDVFTFTSTGTGTPHPYLRTLLSEAFENVTFRKTAHGL